MIDLERRRNMNREALASLRRIERQGGEVAAGSKHWICLGDVFVKRPHAATRAMLEEDGRRLEAEVEALRTSVKKKTSELCELDPSMCDRLGQAAVYFSSGGEGRPAPQLGPRLCWTVTSNGDSPPRNCAFLDYTTNPACARAGGRGCCARTAPPRGWPVRCAAPTVDAPALTCAKSNCLDLPTPSRSRRFSCHRCSAGGSDVHRSFVNLHGVSRDALAAELFRGGV